jgi:hypothetical protein
MKQLTKSHVTGMTLVAVFSIALIFSITQIVSAQAARENLPELNILILTNRQDKLKSAPYISLNLDTKLKGNLDVFGISEDTPGAIQAKNLSTYDVIVFDSYLPKNLTDTTWLYNYIATHNIGILFFGGNYTEDNLIVFGDIIPAYFIVDRFSVNQSYDEALFGPIGLSGSVLEEFNALRYASTKPIEILADQIQVAVSKEEEARDNAGSGTLFSNNIAWQSCPLLRERVFTFARKENTKSIVEVPNTQEPLMVMGKVSDYSSRSSNATCIFISTGVGLIEQYDKGVQTGFKDMNEPFKLWPYFNYLMYASVYTLAEKLTDKGQIESYADWPWSPIPHEREAAIWMTFVASLWVFNFVLFFTLGKKKKAADLAKAGEIPAPTPTPEGENATVKPPENSDTVETTKQSDNA